MVVYRVYFGREFTQDKKTGYWLSRTSPRIRAHRWVWQQHHGEIPKGYHIHHKDDDKSNNEIENLMLLSRADHMKEHCKDENEKEIRRKRLDSIRPLAHAWLRSEEGRKKQSEISKEAWESRKKETKKCLLTKLTLKLLV